MAKITASSTKAADQPVAPSTAAGHGKPSAPNGKTGIYCGGYKDSAAAVKADSTRRNVGK